MSKPLTDDELIYTLKVHNKNDSQIVPTCAELGISPRALYARLQSAKGKGLVLSNQADKPHDFDALGEPILDVDIDELLERRRSTWDHKEKVYNSRKLIPVRINIRGPIGIAHFGDPHLDDDGTNFRLIEEHVQIIQKTPGLFGATVGDLQNNWVGRLGRLYGEQSTSAAESWALTEWFVNAVDWLYMVEGNHDCWTGAGDPVQWMMQRKHGICQANGARLNLIFHNGCEVRVNARHDFQGRSMWNPAHGPSRAVQMGWKDHILTCGHTHISGYNVLKCPMTALISHALRIASYKHIDRYADEKGLPDHNIFECPITIINPYTDNKKTRVQVFFDPLEGAEYLTYLRKKYKNE